MLLAPKPQWGFRCPHDFDNVKIMSFDLRQHPMERVCLSTQMQRTDLVAARTVQFFDALTVLSEQSPEASSLANVFAQRPAPDVV
jgi:hypothetical protein